MADDIPPMPPRPLPPRGIADRGAAWLNWFGLGRLAAVAVSVVLVAGGAWWLLRAPRPPTEATLPFATAASVATTTAPGTAPGAGASSSAASEPEDTTIVVHVAGAVVAPGVYRLPADARVHAAIDAAGGSTVDADLDGLNLAAAVGDGHRVYVPLPGEIDPRSVPSGASDPPGAAAGPVDLNAAGVEELETLPGIGPTTAAAIVDDRTRNGPFASVDDLERVAGIGPGRLDAIRDLVTT